jgi:hypothetical protein
LEAQRSEKCSGSVDKDRRVLSLLPRYGFAVHALRRALPFALLGMNTEVSVPTQCRGEASEIIQLLSAELELHDALKLSSEPPGLLVERAEADNALIVLTGRMATFKRITSEHSCAHICGATGTCSIIIGDSFDAVHSLEMLLEAKQLSQSCSNHRASFLVDVGSDARAFGGHNLQTGEVVEDLSNEICRIHPSIILTPQTIKTRIPESIADYTVMKCDVLGEPVSRDGFARDPICGWPGDYCI